VSRCGPNGRDDPTKPQAVKTSSKTNTQSQSAHPGVLALVRLLARDAARGALADQALTRPGDREDTSQKDKNRDGESAEA
jgi:hypothetical protein